jgi:hypothetical protein
VIDHFSPAMSRRFFFGRLLGLAGASKLARSPIARGG